MLVHGPVIHIDIIGDKVWIQYPPPPFAETVPSCSSCPFTFRLL
jgi:hypothetical protein